MPVARYSPFALYSEELVSFDRVSLDQRLAEGFSAFHGLQGRMYQNLRRKL
jgi:argininosuccinate synthase